MSQLAGNTSYVIFLPKRKAKQGKIQYFLKYSWSYRTMEGISCKLEDRPKECCLWEKLISPTFKDLTKWSHTLRPFLLRFLHLRANSMRITSHKNPNFKWPPKAKPSQQLLPTLIFGCQRPDRPLTSGCLTTVEYVNILFFGGGG